MLTATTQSPGRPDEISYRPVFPFRWVFPLVQLVLCAILLWPVRPRIAMTLHLPALAGQPMVYRFGGPGLAFARWAQDNSMQVVAILNIPAGLVQLPSAIGSSTKSEWRPAGMDSMVWRAITWPVLGMGFWWMAGRGAEALVAARQKMLTPRIRWPEVTVNFLLMAGGITLVFGFVFFAGEDRHDFTLQLLAAGAALWALLGGMPVVARIVQWRLRKGQADLEIQ